MANLSSIQKKYGRYIQGGETDVYSNRLGWWERQSIPSAEDDIEMQITAKYAHRPELMAYDIYGQANLMWVILQSNNILDINTEFVLGKVIWIPSYRRVFFDIVTKPNNSNYID